MKKQLCMLVIASGLFFVGCGDKKAEKTEEVAKETAAEVLDTAVEEIQKETASEDIETLEKEAQEIDQAIDELDNL